MLSDCVCSRTVGCFTMTIISLLTDFGLEDAYVGIVKGVILSVNPEATIVDVSHGVAPQDVVRAAYVLETAYEYFPPGTVHVVVVDPGVGSGRGIVAVEMNGQCFLAPDNGVLTAVLSKNSAKRIVSVENDRYFLSPSSSTFHGRDIFAPVAAHISKGLDIGILGPAVDCEKLVRLHLPKPIFTDTHEILGAVISSDRFGNLITNIHFQDIARICSQAGSSDLAIRVGARTIHGVSDTYASVGMGTPLAVFGSTDRLEISINGDSALRILNVGPGAEIRVKRDATAIQID